MTFVRENEETTNVSENNKSPRLCAILRSLHLGYSRLFLVILEGSYAQGENRKQNLAIFPERSPASLAKKGKSSTNARNAIR